MANSSDFPNYDMQLYQEAASENTSQQRLQELAKISTELARIIARNVNTAPELLSKLSISTDKETRLGIVSNPNTPTDILWQLGKEFPDKLLENPVFSLLLLENPNLADEIPHGTMCSLLLAKEVPIKFLEWGAEYEYHEPQSLVNTN